MVRINHGSSMTSPGQEKYRMILLHSPTSVQGEGQDQSGDVCGLGLQAGMIHKLSWRTKLGIPDWKTPPVIDRYLRNW